MQQIRDILASYSQAIENLQDNTSSAARALEQIVDFWREVLKGDRDVFPGLRR